MLDKPEHEGNITPTDSKCDTECVTECDADVDPDFKEYRKIITFSNFKNYEIEVIFTNDIRRVFYSLNCGGITNRNWWAVTARALGGQKTYIILPLEAGINTFCHEAYHAVNQMFQALGVQVFDGINRSPHERQGVSRPERDQELWAYTLGFLADEIAKFAAECGVW